MQQARQMAFPSTNLEVEIVLPVACRDVRGAQLRSPGALLRKTLQAADCGTHSKKQKVNLYMFAHISDPVDRKREIARHRRNDCCARVQELPRWYDPRP